MIEGLEVDLKPSRPGRLIAGNAEHTACHCICSVPGMGDDGEGRMSPRYSPLFDEEALVSGDLISALEHGDTRITFKVTLPDQNRT